LPEHDGPPGRIDRDAFAEALLDLVLKGLGYR
jgi:hypothetical protein